MYPAVRLPPDEDHVSLTGYIWKYTIGGHYCVELYENDDFVGNTQNKNDDFAVNSIYEKLLNDKLSVNPGYLYENTVAQMLTANGNLNIVNM